MLNAITTDHVNSYREYDTAILSLGHISGCTWADLIGSSTVTSLEINNPAGEYLTYTATLIPEYCFKNSEYIAVGENEMNNLKNVDPDMTISALATLPAIRHLYYNHDAKTTVIVWEDDTVTKVKPAPGTPFSEYHGFCACVTKKVFGTNTQIAKFIQRNKEYHGRKPDGE